MRRTALALLVLAAIIAAFAPATAGAGDPTIVTADFTFLTGDQDLPAPANTFTIAKTQPLFLTNGEPLFLAPHSIVADLLVCSNGAATCLPSQKVPAFRTPGATPPGDGTQVGETEEVTWATNAKKAGTYTFKCGIHPNDMKGTLVITN